MRQDASGGTGTPSSLEKSINLAREDKSEELRLAATRLEGQIPSSNHVSRLAMSLESGSFSEKQAALDALSTIEGRAADELIGLWLDRLSAGGVPTGLQLDLLEAADGKKVFFDKPEAQGVRCHRINDEGGDVGPDLSHIGSTKDRRYLLESIVLPNQQIASGVESVTRTLKNGDTYPGVLKKETPEEIVITSPDTGALTVKKSDLESRRAALSPMPEGLGQILSKQDLRNLIEFLSSQK